ncbi:MAG: DNA topoisomerase VI subunit B, partial [Promethearchaeota archaeon]
MALLDEVQIRSAADFFHDNKAIAGFDNSMKCVFTSVRELVENGLDAAERAVARAKKQVKNLKKQERTIPEELLQWAKRRPHIYVNLKTLESHQIAELLKVDKVSSLESHIDFLQLTVRDNGIGVPFEDIPTLFGRVLTGSNYGARQARGRFGLGVKMVLLNAMATVDLPILVKSRHMSSPHTSKFKILINLQKNEPIIVGGTGQKFEVKDPEALKEPGTEVTVTFTGSWRLAKKWVLEYFHELSIITPYATFDIHIPDQEESIIYERVIDEMPPYPKLTKIHPWGCDITQLKREIAATRITGTNNMIDFMVNHFQRVSKKRAEKFLKLINIDPNKDPKELTSEEIRRIIHDGFLRSKPDEKKAKKEITKSERRFTFQSPEGSGLSPLTAESLERGLKERVSPDFVAAVTRPAAAYAGHSFIVEAALAYGGNLKSGVTIYRYANRIPLLFGAGNDVIYKVVHKEVEWKTYKANIDNSPLAIAVSLVSTKIPFPETSKEYIADVDEIRDEITKALQTLGRNLRTFLSRVERARRERKRTSQFEKYASITLQNLFGVAESSPILPIDIDTQSEKIEKALMTGDPLVVERKRPVSSPIANIPYWLEPAIEKELSKNGIKSAFEFLATPTENLASMKALTPYRVEQVKRETLQIFSQSPDAPNIAELEWVDSELESYLNKKWIRTIYDFLVTPNHTIASISGIGAKLIEFTKQETLKELNNEASIPLSEIPWIDQELFNKLKNQEIHTLFDLVTTASSRLSFISELSYVLIENEKKKIMETFQDLQTGIHEIGWMESSIENTLQEMGISTISELLLFSTHELQSIDRLALKVIDNSKQEIIAQLSQESLTPLSQAEWYTPQIHKKFTRRKIVTQLDFLLYPNSRLARDNDLVLNIIQYVKKKIVQDLNNAQPKALSEMVGWIEPQIKEALEEMNIRTTYDFLTTDIQNLSKIRGLTLSQIERIKTNIGSPLDILEFEGASFNGEMLQKLKSHEIFSIEDLYSSKSKLLKALDASDKKKIETIYDALNAHIGTLPRVVPQTKILLSQFGINLIIEFLIWPKNELEQLDISSKEIDSLKGTIDISEILESKQKGTPLDYLALDTNTLKELEKKDIHTLEDAYFTQRATLEQSQIDLNVISKIKETLNAPITMLPSLKAHLGIVERLLKNGITTIMHFILSPLDSLQEITNASEDELAQLRNNIQIDPLKIQQEKIKLGTPIPLGIGFDNKELKALEQVGIFTIDELFILTKEQFTPHIPWEKINRVKEILESPIMIMENVPVHAIRKLVQQGVSTIFQFLYWPNEKLAQVTGLDVEQITQFKNELRIKKGIPIDSLSQLDSSVRRILSEIDIDTLEEVVVATKEMYELPSDTWRIIQNIKAVLNSPVSLISKLYAKSSETIAPLVQRGVRSILAFLYWPDEDLAETTGIKQESITAIKLNLNFSKIEEILNSPLSFIPALRNSFPEVIDSLQKAEITTIKQFLQTPGLSIQEITGLSIQEIEKIKDFMNPLEIEEIRTKHVIPLSTLATSSKKEMTSIIKKLTKLNVLTYEELIPLKEEDVIDERIEWNILEETKNILDLPIHIMPHLSKEYRKHLETEGITTIEKFIYWPNERLASLLKETNDEIYHLKSQIDLKLIKEITETPITLLLPLELINPLIEADIKTVQDFLLCPNKTLATITQLSKKKLATLKQNIDLQQMRLILELPETLDTAIGMEEVLTEVVNHAIETIIRNNKRNLIEDVTKEAELDIFHNFKDISQNRVRISVNKMEKELIRSLRAERKEQISVKILREIIKEGVTIASEGFDKKVSERFKKHMVKDSKLLLEESFDDLKTDVQKGTERQIMKDISDRFTEKFVAIKEEAIKNAVEKVKAEVKTKETEIAENIQNELTDAATTEINNFVKNNFQKQISDTLREKTIKIVEKKFTKKFIREITKDIIEELTPSIVQEIKETIQKKIDETIRGENIAMLLTTIDEKAIINQAIMNTIETKINAKKLKLEAIKEEFTEDIVKKFDTSIKTALTAVLKTVNSEIVTPLRNHKKGSVSAEKLNEIVKETRDVIKKELTEQITETIRQKCSKMISEFLDKLFDEVKEREVKNAEQIRKKFPKAIHDKLLTFKEKNMTAFKEKIATDKVVINDIEKQKHNIEIQIAKDIEPEILNVLKDVFEQSLRKASKEALRSEFSASKMKNIIKDVIEEEKPFTVKGSEITGILQAFVNEKTIILQTIKNAIETIKANQLKLEDIKEELTEDAIKKFDTSIQKSITVALKSVNSEFITPLKRSKKGKISNEKLTEITTETEERIKKELTERVTEKTRQDCAKRINEIIDETFIKVKESIKVEQIDKKLQKSINDKITTLKETNISAFVKEQITTDKVAIKDIEKHIHHIEMQLGKGIEKTKEIERSLKEKSELLLRTMSKGTLKKDFSAAKMRKIVNDIIEEEKTPTAQPIINSFIDKMIKEEESTLKKTPRRKKKEPKTKTLEEFMPTKDSKKTTGKKTTGKKTTGKKTTGKKTTGKKTTG